MLCTAVKTKQALRSFVCYGTMLLLALGQTSASEENINFPGSTESVVNETYQFLQTTQTPFVIAEPTFDFSGYQTYKIYVETMNSDDFVHRVYGDAAHNASFSAPSGIYNNNYCLGATSGQAPSADFFYGGYNSHTFDSWVGIGLTSFPNTVGGEVDVTVQESAGLSWSDNFALEFMSSGNYGPVDFSFDDVNTEGGWVLEDLNATNGFTGDDYRAIVMQVTSPATIVWTLNAEIYVHGDPNNVVLISQTFDGTSLGPVLIEGCTDSNACNYYDLATVDNGTCTLPPDFYDCDDVCLNDIDGDGVCDELEIPGCQDNTACNYMASATDENNTCVYSTGCETCSGETDGTGTTVDNDSDDDGVCDADEVVGCQDVAACNYMTAATDAGTCVYVDGVCETCSGETDGTGTTVDNDSDDDSVCDADEIVGCQDASGCNYNSAATDAGTCIYVDGICETCSGETDGSGTTVDNDSDDDGVCDADEIEGCQDATACNFDMTATDEDGSCAYCGCDNLTGLSAYSLTIEEHAVDGIAGHTTYRAYINMEHPNDYLSAVFGENEALAFALSSTATPNWYNHENGVDFATDLNEAFIDLVPELAYDSWFTIGAETTHADVDVDFTAGPGNDIRVPFNAGEDILVNDAYGATFYSVRSCDLPPGEGGNSCSEDHPAIGGSDGRVLIAQITTTGELSGQLAAQILQNGQYGQGVYHTVHFSFDGEGSFSSDSWSGAMNSNYQDCGCTDATAVNYDEDALHDNSTCIPTILGCMDAAACNYMAAATVDNGACAFVDGICETCSGETDGTGTIVDNDSDDDGVCNADEVVGCQEALACNYNSAATDAGDCVFVDGVCETCSGETDGTGTPVDNDSDNDGVCNADEVVGCQEALACNYNSAATDAGDCVFVDGVCETCSGETDGTGTPVDNDSDNDGVCNADEVVGCQEALACNYNSAATDAGDCVFVDGVCETCSGETDGTGTPVDNDSDNDGVCNADEVVGCQEALACNYNSAATDAGDCVFVDGVCETCSGETDGTGTPVDNDSDNDGVCNADEVVGCQEALACNYNSAATDAGDCVFVDGVCETCSGETDGTGTPVDNDSDNDGVCNADEVVGCQEALACNYNSAATDAGDCVFVDGVCETCSGETDGTGTPVDNDSDNDGVCNADEVVGCQEALACNYNSAATDAGDCVFVDGVCETCSGETDGTGTPVDNDSDDDGVCNADEVVGCQEALACNYNSAATDAGDCVFVDGVCETCSGETDGTGTPVDNDSDDDGVCDADEIQGCQDVGACNFMSSATDGGVECAFATGPCDVCIGSATDGTGTVLDQDDDDDLVCNADEISGCQDVLACNFMASATDAADCVYPMGCETCSGESDGTGSIVSNDDDGDGVCNADEVEGCIAPTACNYNAAATDAGSCEFAEGCETCSGATDGTGTIIDNDSDGDGICNADEIAGCQNELACNYVANATDAGDCYVAGVYYDCSGDCLNDEDGDGICDEIEALMDDAEFEGFLSGFDFGVETCVGAEFCGDGTVWSEDFQMCVEDSSCPGDLNDDLVVGTGDLLLLLMDYGFYCNE